MAKTVAPENFGANPPTAAQSDTSTSSGKTLRRRRMRYFKRADFWFNRFVRFATSLHEGFWLGYLGRDELNAITAGHYDLSQESASPEHNLRGFFDWELAAVSRYFPPESQVLVAAAGGGREVLALRRAGYRADGFECNPMLVEASDLLFDRVREPRAVMLFPPDQVPSGSSCYEGIIVGWGAYSHIPTRLRRVQFLKALRRRMQPGSPILLSFFLRAGDSRYHAFVYRIANATRQLLRGQKEPLELGDHLTWSYSHWFTREEVEAELGEASIRMVHFGEVGDGHAVGIVE
jgi:hypothetical protein